MTDTSTKTDAKLEAPPDDQHRDTDDAPTVSESDDGFDPRSDTIRRYLAWGGLAVCSVVAVVALIRFYGGVTDTIDLWIDPKYQPLTHAAFNLTVLLTSLVGVSLLVRELSGRE